MLKRVSMFGAGKSTVSSGEDTVVADLNYFTTTARMGPQHKEELMR